MTLELRERLRALARPANPSEMEMVALVRGWNDYFVRTNVPTHMERSEFDAVMRARVKSGIISLVAPDAQAPRA